MAKATKSGKECSLHRMPEKPAHDEKNVDCPCEQCKGERFVIWFTNGWAIGG